MLTALVSLARGGKISPLFRLGILALLAAAITASGCSAIPVTAPSAYPTTQETWECGRTPGTAGTWRPQLNYCEY